MDFRYNVVVRWRRSRPDEIGRIYKVRGDIDLFGGACYINLEGIAPGQAQQPFWWSKEAFEVAARFGIVLVDGDSLLPVKENAGKYFVGTTAEEARKPTQAPRQGFETSLAHRRPRRQGQ